MSPAAVKGLKRGWTSQERAIISSLAVLVFLGIWESVVTYFKFLDPLFVSSPSLILAAGRDLLASGELVRHTIVTLQNLVIGFVLAALVGNFAGIAMGRMR